LHQFGEAAVRARTSMRVFVMAYGRGGVPAEDPFDPESYEALLRVDSKPRGSAFRSFLRWGERHDFAGKGPTAMAGIGPFAAQAQTAGALQSAVPSLKLSVVSGASANVPCSDDGAHIVSPFGPRIQFRQSHRAHWHPGMFRALSFYRQALPTEGEAAIFLDPKPQTMGHGSAQSSSSESKTLPIDPKFLSPPAVWPSFRRGARCQQTRNAPRSARCVASCGLAASA